MARIHVAALVAALSALVCGSPSFAITLGSGGDAKTVDLGQTFDLEADSRRCARWPS
jgi:hypothetical protein